MHAHIRTHAYARTIFAAMLLIIALSGCAQSPSPLELARANQMEASTRATATAAAQAVQERAIDIHKKQVEAEAWESSIKSAQSNINHTTSIIIRFGGIALMVAIIVIIGVATRRFVQVSGTIARASEASAMLRAVQIPVDRATRTFPLLAINGHIHNPNTGHVLAIGLPNDADRLLVQADAQIRASGVLADQAGKIGTSRHGESWRAADVLPAIAKNVPLIDTSEDDHDRR